MQLGNTKLIKFNLKALYLELTWVYIGYKEVLLLL